MPEEIFTTAVEPDTNKAGSDAPHKKKKTKALQTIEQYLDLVGLEMFNIALRDAEVNNIPDGHINESIRLEAMKAITFINRIATEKTPKGKLVWGNLAGEAAKVYKENNLKEFDIELMDARTWFCVTRDLWDEDQRKDGVGLPRTDKLREKRQKFLATMPYSADIPMGRLSDLAKCYENILTLVPAKERKTDARVKHLVNTSVINALKILVRTAKGDTNQRTGAVTQDGMEAFEKDSAIHRQTAYKLLTSQSTQSRYMMVGTIDKLKTYCEKYSGNIRIDDSMEGQVSAINKDSGEPVSFDPSLKALYTRSKSEFLQLMKNEKFDGLNHKDMVYLDYMNTHNDAINRYLENSNNRITAGFIDDKRKEDTESIMYPFCNIDTFRDTPEILISNNCARDRLPGEVDKGLNAFGLHCPDDRFEGMFPSQRMFICSKLSDWSEFKAGDRVVLQREKGDVLIGTLFIKKLTDSGRVRYSLSHAKKDEDGKPQLYRLDFNDKWETETDTKRKVKALYKLHADVPRII